MDKNYSLFLEPMNFRLLLFPRALSLSLEPIILFNNSSL
jgi:hypothetical protein